ncbi:MAG: hypothetical protein JOZ96_17365 [Acidobacteria bacterium]|nr:hypothetical protein [Acidobacteriota bacterium]
MKGELRDLPEGWYPASEQDESRLADELRRELTPGHLLYGRPVRVIAHRNGATDDILVAHRDQPGRFTVVHLTWRGGPEINQAHPSVECDGDYAAFLEYEARWSARE